MSALLIALAMLIPAVRQADAASLFAKGVTFPQFLADVQAQRGTWLQNSDRAKASTELVERLRKVSGGLTLLAVSEAACSDAVNTIPYVARLATLAGVELRIVDKLAGAAILERHRTPDGRAATPTVVLLRQGQEVGVWVERPASLQAWHTAAVQTMSSQDRLTRKLSWYDWDRGETTMAELVALAEKK